MQNLQVDSKKRLFVLVVAILLTSSLVQAQSVWQEASPFPTRTYIWTYVGPGRYYDPILYMRMGQEKLFFYTQGAPPGLMQYRYPGGEWQTIGFTYFEPGEHWFGFCSNAIDPPWSTVGEYAIDFRWLDLASHWQTHSFIVHVIPPAQRLFTDDHGNSMFLWQGGTSSLNYPCLVVEGFDAQNTSFPQSYYKIGSSFFDQLRTYDRDVLILDFADGGKGISENAQFVKSALSYINSIKTETNSIVLAGLSMGGVVCRYALAEAEQNSQNLNVSLFFSIDAPQQEAVIDNNFQNYIKDHDQGTANPSLSSMAAKQMLRYNTYDPSGATHTNFYVGLNQLNGNGYPHLSRNVGVSFAPSTENPNSGEWLRVTLMFTGLEPIIDIPISEAAFYINPGDPWKEGGSYLPKSTTMQWGGVQQDIPFISNSIPMVILNLQINIPFLFYELDRQKNPTFIPHNSALDKIGGVSKFDVTYSSSTPRFHDEFPSELATPLLNEVLGPPEPLYVSISGPSTVSHPGKGQVNNYTWIANVAGGVAPYVYSWKKNGYQVGSNSPQYQEGFHFDGWNCDSYQITYRVDVTDANQGSTYATKNVVAWHSCGGEQDPFASDKTRLPEFSLPVEFGLGQNYPNPFNPETEIAFALPERSSVKIVVSDVLGRQILTLVDREYSAGYQRVTWKAVDASGTKVGSGVYFYRIAATGESGKQFTKVMKMNVTK